MTLFYLIAAHFLCDFSLQNDVMAVNKNRNARTELQNHVNWYWWMIAHAFIHGGAVALITNNVWLGIAEVALHFIIDFGKCERWYNIHVDQAMHIACKLIWFWVMLWM